jgi:hypothetical protein
MEGKMMVRQQCSTDTDCPPDYVCVDGECVPRNGVPPPSGPYEKIYQFWGQYYVPAGEMYYVYIDGVYIDGELFDKNIPVRDGTIHMVVAPQTADFIDKSLDVGFPTFKDGKVIRIGHGFSWGPNDISTQSYDLAYDGHPYGMGLNTIVVQLNVFPYAKRDLWFNLLYKFTMEVG